MAVQNNVIPLRQCRVIPKVDCITWDLIKASFTVVKPAQNKTIHDCIGNTTLTSTQGGCLFKTIRQQA